MQHVLRQLAHPGGGFNGARLLAPGLPGAPTGQSTSQPQGSAPAREVVQQSFFGVGAPEALLVGVVALVVFGPKGLAEAARSVGSALRTFQPTIKEVVQVSQELKGTLEKELGINELREAARPSPITPTPRPLSDLAATAGQSQQSFDEAAAKSVDPEIEAKRLASAQMAWGAPAEAAGTAAAASASTAAAGAAGPAAAAATATAPAQAAPAQQAEPAGKDLGALSMEELEAELGRRRAAATSKAPSGHTQ